MALTHSASAHAQEEAPPHRAGWLAVVIQGRGAAEVALLLPDVPLLVGRAASCRLQLDEETLSAEHARFLLSGDEVLVEDLGSREGTWVAGQRVEKARLAPGDRVMLGAVGARIHLLSRAEGAVPEEGAQEEGGVLEEVGVLEEQGLVVGRAMREPLRVAQRIASARVPVLIHGETGTGKELLARLIHDQGPRRHKRLVSINCGAIPRELVEATLFGHERGAFTGAVQKHQGVFGEADGGTVFLDEVGELPLAAQAALLRVLETGSFSRVGSSRETVVDARIVAATHRSLEAMVEAGQFRADLYYRLSTVVLELPPLRERADELELLIQRFLDRANEANGREVRGLQPEAVELLRGYDWPGNVRELRNAIERAVAVAGGPWIGPEDLPPALRLRRGALARATAAEPSPPAELAAPETLTDLRERVQRYEAKLLEGVLASAGWNQAEAARRLGMPVRTLGYRMKVLGIRKRGA